MLTAMQSLISFFATVALAILPQLVFSEEAPTHPVKPLLWKIEGKGLSKPSYLFGTIHLGSGPLAKLHPAAEAAFEQSDVLYTEIPFDQKTQLGATRLLLRNDQKTLVQSIGEKLKNRLDEELAAINPQLDSEPFQSLKTWAVAATLPMLKAQIGGEQAMDGTLWQRAEAEEKKTDSIETVESQLGVFDAFNEEEQIIMLSETLKMMKEDRLAKKDSMQELIDAYVTGDLQSLQKTLDKSLDEMRKGEHKELGERFYKKLLTDRDASMAEVIVKKLANSPGDCHFFAAGAAHFAGDKSIRAHLEKAGYKITRIEK
jgi:uncharacterized protein YbaP (TraB family)